MAERIAVAPVRRGASKQATTDRQRSRPPLSKDARTGRPPAPATAKRSFRVPEVVLGVLLVAGSALAAVLWQQSTNTTTTIVVASRPITRGSVITAVDLRGAQIGGETDAMIPGRSALTLVGRIAVVDIAAGVPLSPSLVTAEQPLGPDEALTSMALEPGHVPPDLAPNDHVRIVVTAASDSLGATATSLLDAEAVVWSVGASPDGISVIVTVRGPLSLSTEVAAASSVRLARVDG